MTDVVLDTQVLSLLHNFKLISFVLCAGLYHRIVSDVDLEEVLSDSLKLTSSLECSTLHSMLSLTKLHFTVTMGVGSESSLGSSTPIQEPSFSLEKY